MMWHALTKKRGNVALGDIVDPELHVTYDSRLGNKM
jgi:hypothetical protein